MNCLPLTLPLPVDFFFFDHPFFLKSHLESQLFKLSFFASLCNTCRDALSLLYLQLPGALFALEPLPTAGGTKGAHRVKKHAGGLIPFLLH